jgi:hypothetical protein
MMHFVHHLSTRCFLVSAGATFHRIDWIAPLCADPPDVVSVRDSQTGLGLKGPARVLGGGAKRRNINKHT